MKWEGRSSRWVVLGRHNAHKRRIVSCPNKRARKYHQSSHGCCTRHFAIHATHPVQTHPHATQSHQRYFSQPRGGCTATRWRCDGTHARRTAASAVHGVRDDDPGAASTCDVGGAGHCVGSAIPNVGSTGPSSGHVRASRRRRREPHGRGAVSDSLRRSTGVVLCLMCSCGDQLVLCLFFCPSSSNDNDDRGLLMCATSNHTAGAVSAV